MFLKIPLNFFFFIHYRSSLPYSKALCKRKLISIKKWLQSTDYKNVAKVRFPFSSIFPKSLISLLHVSYSFIKCMILIFHRYLWRKNVYFCWFQPKAVAAPAAGQTRLGIEAKKEENLPEWYHQVKKIHFTVATRS